jgi:hypothetical protein
MLNQIKNALVFQGVFLFALTYNKVTRVIAIATTLVFYVPLAPLTHGTRLRQHCFYFSNFATC